MILTRLEKLLRLFHTLRYLRPRQIGYRLLRRLWRPKPDLRPAPPLRPRPGAWTAPIAKPAAMLGPNRFRFLNQEGEVAAPGAWNDPRTPKLWLYNLHYFDDLIAEGSEQRRAWHLDLIRRWVAENSPGEGNGWEPYPISLRAVNWIKWALSGNELSPAALDSLGVQIRLLYRRPEYHLLGNHLWANAKALVFAGLFFEGEEAEGWLRKGLAIVRREIGEQVLADGGHFERSPLYHAIFLEDLLDLLNLFVVYGHKPEEEWLFAISLMRTWLEVMSHPDGGIVLFNDAAFGVAPGQRAVDAYARRLGLGEITHAATALTRFPETGYIRCEKGRAVLFIDAAPIGADYIPGHAHADTLTFELSLFGRRIIVDSGTSTYEKNAERQRQRGTAAHNTACLDGADSSEVWGGFRVGRRARPLDLKTAQTDRELVVCCAHDGYRRLPGRPLHRREWRLTASGLSIRDRIEGGFREAVARCRFHPEVEVVLNQDGTGKGSLLGGEAFAFRVARGFPRLVPSTYHPEFNAGLPTCCLEIVLDGAEAEVYFSWDSPGDK